MPARKVAASRRPALRKGRCDPARLAALFQEIMPVSEEQPEEVFAWFDGKGTIRKAEARYANGWVVCLRFNAEHKLTSRSASLKLTTKVKP